VSWDESKIVDTPVLGRYDSSNPPVIEKHLEWIEDLDVDFVILSWWGFQDTYGKFTDNVAKQILSQAQQIQKPHPKKKTRELPLAKHILNKDVEFIKVKKDKRYTL
jgi:hypothetical protein